MIRVVCKARLKPDVKLEEYLKIAREVVSKTQTEKGCNMYAIHQDLNDPMIITMIEEWADEEALNQHNQTEHVTKLVPELRNLRESTELNIYREIK